MLSRDAVKQKLISWGVENPTDEQINDYLGQINKEIKSSEEKAAHYRDEANRVKELEKELKEMTDSNLSDVEKANKAMEEAKAEVENLKQTVKQMNLEKSLAEIGIVGDDAAGLFENGELNTTKLGEILSNREKNAVAAYQKDTLNNTPAPQGGGSDEKKESPDVAYAKEYAAKNKGNDITQKVIDIYK